MRKICKKQSWWNTSMPTKGTFFFWLESYKGLSQYLSYFNTNLKRFFSGVIQTFKRVQSTFLGSISRIRFSRSGDCAIREGGAWHFSSFHWPFAVFLRCRFACISWAAWLYCFVEFKRENLDNRSEKAIKIAATKKFLFALLIEASTF